MAWNAFKMCFHTDRCICRRRKYLQSILRPLIDLYLTWFVLEVHSFEAFSKQSWKYKTRSILGNFWAKRWAECSQNQPFTSLQKIGKMGWPTKKHIFSKSEIPSRKQDFLHWGQFWKQDLSLKCFKKLLKFPEIYFGHPRTT